ncbi:hypothetical protein ACN469_12845 [Corallococcus terminator]
MDFWMDHGEAIKPNPTTLALPFEASLLPYMLNSVISHHADERPRHIENLSSLPNGSIAILSAKESCSRTVCQIIPSINDLDIIVADSKRAQAVRASASVLAMLHPDGGAHIAASHMALYPDVALGYAQMGPLVALAVGILSSDDLSPSTRHLINSLLAAQPTSPVGFWATVLGRMRERSYAPITSVGAQSTWLQEED